jgi:hypothetical protein
LAFLKLMLDAGHKEALPIIVVAIGQLGLAAGGLLCGQLHGVRLCTGGQWITWIAGSGHKLMVEKKLHGVFSRARLVRSRIQTGAPASWVVLALSQLRNQLVHRPAAPSC